MRLTPSIWAKPLNTAEPGELVTMQSGEDLTKGIVAAVPSESRKILIVLQSQPVYRFIHSNSTVALSFGNDYGFFVGKDSRQAQGQRLTTKKAALIDIDKVLMRALGPATFSLYTIRDGQCRRHVGEA